MNNIYLTTGVRKRDIAKWTALNILKKTTITRGIHLLLYFNGSWKIWNPLKETDQAALLVQKVAKKGYNYYYNPNKGCKKHVVNLQDQPDISDPAFRHIRGESDRSMAEALTLAAITFVNCKNIQKIRVQEYIKRSKNDES